MQMRDVHTEIGSRKYRKGDAYVKRQDSSSRSIRQYSGV